jgi:hypothetical protein
MKIYKIFVAKSDLTGHAEIFSWFAGFLLAALAGISWALMLSSAVIWRKRTMRTSSTKFMSVDA